MLNFFQRIARAAVPAALLLLTACSVLPNSGPSANDVIQNAGSPQAPRYELVDIDPAVIAILRQNAPDSFKARFGDYRPSVEPKIGVGDAVSVTIWEASSGGLFSSASVVSTVPSAGSRSAMIPDQVVGRDGAITVPYAGRVHVAGSTTRAAGKIIEHALIGKAIDPQVLVNVTRSASNTVTVTGEVVTGARVPLNVNGDRIMDVIAMAGGVRAPINETYVQLTRGSKTIRVPLNRVASDPKENIYLRANDVLTLIRDPQTFIAYGATGQNAEIRFDAEGLNLAQAMAKSGGLIDSRSDAAGLFVFRYEPAYIARALRPDSPLVQPGRLTPFVFRLNLHDPNSLFLAQNFAIKNKDVLYVSNAPIIELEKAMQVFSTLQQPVSTGASLCIASKTC